MAEPLPDETIVIRGGENKLTDVKERAEEAANAGDGYVLSGNADPSMDLDGILRVARQPHPKISKTTVARLVAAGCGVTPPTGTKRHVTIVLPQPPTDDDYIRFQEAFDPSEKNLHRGKSRR